MRNLSFYLFAFVLALSSVRASVAANAQHCKYLSSKYAQEAFRTLSLHKAAESLPIVDRYCEPCKDPYVKPLIMEELEYRPYQVKGYASIAINGEEVDLAYLYLNGKNLGHSHNCKTEVASEYLFSQNSKDSL